VTTPCPFCNKDPAEFLFQTDLVYGIWDNFPVNEGHLLVISKRHVADWFELTDDEKREIQDGLNLGRTLIQSRHKPQGFNIGINVGEAAGQTIPHLHVHLIPRYEGDVPDPRGGVRHVIPDKGNYLAKESRPHYLVNDSVTSNRLIHGLDNPLAKQLKSQIDQSDSVDIAVAFVLRSGVELIYENLQDLVARGGRLRLLTGDYLNFTDPEQLQRLDDLKVNDSEGLDSSEVSMQGHVDIRVFECKGTNFHPKAYIFRKKDGSGTAYIGSSNLTRPALTDAVEWNYRVIDSDADEAFAEVTAAFENLFEHPNVKDLTHEWIKQYRRHRIKPSTDQVTDVSSEPDEPPPPLTPYSNKPSRHLKKLAWRATKQDWSF
jgi:HKD family nuclease/diadenosine tetraphosphate (Ap4A) HIT family hydrolase